MDAMSDQSAQDRELREALRAKMQFLHSASDRKHAGGLAAWYGEFTPKQRGFARVLLERAEQSARSGRGQVAQTGDLWETSGAQAPASLSPYVKALVAQGALVEAIKAHRAYTGAGLREAKEACEAYRDTLRRGDERAETGQAGTAPSAAPAAPRQDVTVSGADLEAALTRVVEPALAGIQSALGAKLYTQQETFQREAAKKIAESVLASALRELEARKPREVRVTVQRADGSEHRLEGVQPHPKFEHLLRAASLRLANGYAPGILLAGEASSGKTHGCKMAAEALGLSWHFNGAISFPHEMLGFIDAGGTYHTTPFRQAYEFGGWYTFDEVDRSDPVALLSVNPHLAGDRATFPDKQVARHKDCILTATANTWGHGADGAYSGATKLDAAFLSRFPVRIAWDIDAALEEKLIGGGDWLKRLRSDREKARAAGLKVLIDVRAGLAGAGLVAAGYSVQDVAEMTYLASLKPDQRKLLGGA